MPNPSEMQRAEDERNHVKLNILRKNMKDFMFRDKATREGILREIRNLERELGVESQPYNSNDF